MAATIGWVVMAVVIVSAATVGLCMHDLSSSDFLGLVGASGVLGGAGAHLSGSSGP